MNRIAIIYHDADFDGKLSNEVCRFHLKKLHPDSCIHSYGWDYGRPIPRPCQLDTDPVAAGGAAADWSDYSEIYIVDLSVDELMARSELWPKIVWIDHHKSAIEKWVNQGDKKYGFQFSGYQIDGVAACRLCWQWFDSRRWFDLTEGHSLPIKEDFVDRKVPEPELLRLAGEYDIWDHRDPNAEILQFGLRAMKPEDLEMLITQQFSIEPGVRFGLDMLKTALDWGYMIKLYCDKQNDEYSALFARTLEWEGLKFCCLNIGQRGNSDLLNGGLKLEHQACFAWRHTGDAVLVSLYHVPGHTELDLSKIAVKYGGGGHRGACGFRITLGQLNDIISK